MLMMQELVKLLFCECEYYFTYSFFYPVELTTAAQSIHEIAVL